VIISYSSSHLLEGELMLKPNIHAFSMSVLSKPSRNPNIMEKRHNINRYARILETYICSGMVHYTGSWRVLHGFQAWEAAQRG
jgi:hypothetical protein